MSIAEYVRRQFRRVPEGGVIASRALHRLSVENQQVDKAASRLYKTEGLEKLRNGLYYKPHTSKYFGTLPPKEKDVIDSIKQQYAAKVSPSGALAAYELGLTNALPDTITYDTDKRISPIRLDDYTLYFHKVDDKKLLSAKGELLMLLKAMEFLFKNGGEINALQQRRIIRLLGQFPPSQIVKAISHWPRWFQTTVQSFIPKSGLRYITGLSALNIPYKGKQADWHQLGMLRSDQLQVAGNQYDSAPNTRDEELFDCSAFLQKHHVDVGTVLCATPLRAVKDILYTYIFKKNQYPSFFMLNEFMLEIPHSTVLNAIEDLKQLANVHQKQLLTQWADENDLN